MKPKPKEGVNFVRRKNYNTEMSDGGTMKGFCEIKDNGSYTMKVEERERRNE